MADDARHVTAQCERWEPAGQPESAQSFVALCAWAGGPGPGSLRRCRLRRAGSRGRRLTPRWTRQPAAAAARRVVRSAARTHAPLAPGHARERAICSVLRVVGPRAATRNTSCVPHTQPANACSKCRLPSCRSAPCHRPRSRCRSRSRARRQRSDRARATAGRTRRLPSLRGVATAAEPPVVVAAEATPAG